MNSIRPVKWLSATLFAALIMAFPFAIKAQESAKVKNIILVHGAFADGSGWEGVYKILAAKGYHVTALQYPMTSLEDDVVALNRAIDKQDGPTILVGHSYGGMIITEAGVSPKVAALVYVAAFEPEVGESLVNLVQTAPAAPENGILPPDDKGFVYYDEAKFHDGFAGDLPKEKTAFMYASQGAISVKCFTTPATHTAWKEKPSYAVLTTDDKSINPVIQENMVKRSGAKVTRIKASHVVFISHPKEVAAVIESAAKR
ncbi:alpha/beta hydrolase [Chitinophaga filiformis]|uniref:alpha/beta hydrolase n=1 Tax=Chitinophaga filiformis TaxID=104663 RepID=UPI001F18EC42|nr:alpha/beta hydrolase [Chitinophaga filiformis]MCF6406485.1 alpha/beta hydrolase [Chitinophaga filiformis]